MHDLFFSGNALWFTIPAVVGSTFFLFRLVLMLLGGHIGDVHFDAAHGGGDLHHGDSNDAFKLLSVQSVAAFLMGFGWGGLGGLKGADWSFTTSTVFAAGIGAGMWWLVGLLLKGLYDLQSSGNIALDEAIGAEGAVYANVPPRGQGRGQVRVVIENRQRIYNAISDGEALNSSTRVRVTGINEDNTITVTPA